MTVITELRAQVLIRANGGVLILNEDTNALIGTAGGFSVRKEDKMVSESLAEFERYIGKEAWEKAFSLLPQVTEGPANGLVAAPDGFFIPTRARFRQMLVGLSPAGRQAFRLFVDGKARQLWAQLQNSSDSEPGSPTSDIVLLQDLFDKYFISSIGDQIADG